MQNKLTAILISFKVLFSSKVIYADMIALRTDQEQKIDKISELIILVFFILILILISIFAIKHIRKIVHEVAIKRDIRKTREKVNDDRNNANHPL